MPRAARFRIAAIEDLLAQLRYAPDDTRLKQMNAAERLLAEVDPDRSYPEDFVTFRITGYRPDSGATPATFVGGALVSDLVIFIQALSDELAIAVSDLGRSPLSLAEVAARLRVSGKTVQRYRRLGLVCHYVTGEGGPRRLVCFEDALEAFATRHAERVTRAAGFSRV
ncbi:MAG: hypothetical protein KDA25_06400, partial [Phycisphaerales bacterium]|nr:hypothetical protein [Phycisphaerales bacterium]